MKFIIIALTCMVLAGTLPAQADPMQKMNLTEEPAGLRFPPGHKFWPGNFGEAAVCWWAGDKTAAVSVTIDDNFAGDHADWIELGNQFGYGFTWMLMTGAISNWTTYLNLYNNGHDLQGHDYGAVNDLPLDEYEAALLKTIDDIETNIPGNKCIVYAYPFGTYANYRTVAKHFVAARGVYGTPNKVFQTWYMNTNSSRLTIANIDKVLKTSGALFYRGWLSTHVHGIKDWDGKTEVAKQLQYVKDNEDELWMALWKDAALYGQSRDTHILTLGGVALNEIKFTVGDSMVDSLYTYPLTVKVRLNDDWGSVTAEQNGEAVKAVLKDHEGNRYVLVDAVPDAGEVTLTNGTPVGITTPDVFFSQNARSYEIPVGSVVYDMQGRILSGSPNVSGMYLTVDDAGNTSRMMFVK